MGRTEGYGLLALSRFDIISIWTAKANQAAEMKQGKLRCLQAFHNKRRKRHQGCRGLLGTGARQRRSVHSPLTLSPPQTHNCAKILPDPEVPRKETAFRVAAVVYNSL